MNAPGFPWLRPELDFRALAEAGTPFATVRVIDALWSMRLVPWHGLDPAEEKAWLEVWEAARELQSLDCVRAWAAQARSLVWGAPQPVSEQQDDWEYGEGPRRWGRARRILGPRLANWLADDEWALDAERWYLRSPINGWGALERARDLRIQETRGGALSVAATRAHASGMCQRFGLRRFSAAGSLSPMQLRSALTAAQDGLAGFATALGWDDEEVGARHLSLSFELEPEDDMAACLDPLTSTISLGREGWGSFAHEWAHAIDISLGTHWAAGRPGYSRYGSVIAEDPSSHLPDEHRVLRSFLQRRDHDASASPFELHRRLIASIPAVMGDLSTDIPEVWLHRLDVRLRALDNWVDAAHRGGSHPERLRQQWAQWCLGNHIAWSDPDTPALRPWRARWERLEAVAGDLAFGPSPQRRIWAVWAAGKDAHADRVASLPAYHDTPHERFARSFHAYLRSTLGHDTWAAGPASRPDQYPVGPDIEHCQRWWPKVLREMKPLWLAHGARLAQSPEASDIAASRASRKPAFAR